MANENYDPYDQAYWGKGKGKKGKKGKSKFQYPYDGNKGYPSYENGKGKSGHEKAKSKTFAATAEKTEEQPAIQQTAPSIEPTYAGWTEQDWDQSWIWNEHGWYSSHETSSTGQALMAFRDAEEHHEKKAIHGKLIQSDTVSEHNLSVTTNHGEIAHKGLTNYVYDGDNSIKFPSGDLTKSETVCAAKSSETKEDLATPKIIGSQKQDQWILDKKNKQLIRAHITPRKALFTPNRAKECPINPDNISRERTTEIIDASVGGDPDILEDNWRLTSQANKPIINLWTGKAIFTFADNLLKDEEAGSGSAADRIIDKKGRLTIEPDPFAPSSEEPTSLPLALGRIHKRLSNPEELKKLHLQHYHMTTDQFRFRTRSLHLPKSTFDLFDKIRSECEVCQAAKHAPSRSKTSGLRADTFGDMTFIDHCQVPLGTGEHIIVFVILDGATTLLTAEAVTTTQEVENITVLRNYFDQYHLQPKSVVADQAFMTETWEHFYQSLDITPISLGPNTPWPNRAEAAVRLLQGTTQDHAKFHQGRNSTCNTEESDIQTAGEGRCNCQESDCHLRGCNTIGARIRETTSRSHPTRCRNTNSVDD